MRLSTVLLLCLVAVVASCANVVAMGPNTLAGSTLETKSAATRSLRSKAESIDSRDEARGVMSSLKSGVKKMFTKIGDWSLREHLKEQAIMYNPEKTMAKLMKERITPQVYYEKLRLGNPKYQKQLGYAYTFWTWFENAYPSKVRYW